MKLKSLSAPRLLLLGLALWAGCAASPTGSNGRPAGGEQKVKDNASPTPAPGQPARPYSTDLGELRAAFNRDKGKVRLVTLLSPT